MLQATRFWSPHFWFRTLKLAAKCLDIHLWSCADKNARMAQSISSSKWKYKKMVKLEACWKDGPQWRGRIYSASYFDRFRTFPCCQALFTETPSASSENLWGHYLDGSCRCTLSLPPCCLNDGVHYAGVNVNVTAILEGERELGELPFVTAFPKSLPQRRWAHLPPALLHTKGARLGTRLVVLEVTLVEKDHHGLI